MSGKAVTGNQYGRSLLICSVLLILTLAVYSPTLRHDFVNYDDGDYVLDNTAIQNGLNWPCVVWAFKTGHASNWHPLTWISHALDCQFYGLKPGGHHLTSLLFHAANALLVFWVLRSFTRAVWRCAFVAALFAWHPLHVESVAWVSERKDVLSTFFWLLALLAYANYAKAANAKDPRPKFFYGLTLFAFGLGLLSKPMVVTLPFVLLLLDYWPLKRIADSKKVTTAPKHEIRRLVLEKVPFFLLAIGSSVVTFFVQREGGAVSNSLSVGARLANALVSYLRYVGKVLWPQNLSVLYPHPGSWPLLLVLTAVLFLLVVSTIVLLVGRSRPYLPVGWFWFLGTLVPVIGLVQVGVQSMADRYTYIPSIGLFLMMAWGVQELLAGWERSERVLSCGCALILAACLVLTYKQVQYWQNGGTLFRHVVQVTRNNYLAYNNLGYYLENHGQQDEALDCYQKAISINPNYEEAQNNLGHLLAARGRNEEAIACYQKALAIKPSLVEAHNNLGNALSNLGRIQEGIAEYETALHYKPDDEDAHNNLGIARAMQGRLEEAAALLSDAVRLKPSDAGAHSNLGNVLAAQHKYEEATRQYQFALHLKPEDAQARNNLANVLIEQGRLDEARENYLEALKLNPKNPEANCNLGILLVRQGKPEEAAARFTEALRLKPDYAAAQQQLDALKAGAGSRR